MKNNILTFLLTICLAAGCSTVQNKNNDDLRAVFDNYISVAKNASIAERSKYYTPVYWQEFDAFSYDPAADILNTDKILGSLEKIEGNRGCLVLETVNKKTRHDRDFQIDFVKRNNHWLFDYVGAISYGDSKRQLKDRSYFCGEIRQEKIEKRRLNRG